MALEVGREYQWKDMPHAPVRVRLLARIPPRHQMRGLPPENEDRWIIEVLVGPECGMTRRVFGGELFDIPV